MRSFSEVGVFMIDIDAQEKMIWFSKSFNEQMSWIDEEVDNIIKHLKNRIQERGRAAYGEPGYAYAVKQMFDIIKADPKNRALMREIRQAERELIAFLYDEPNAPSEQEISAYWRKYFDAYIAEIEQSPSLYYLLVKTPKPGGGSGEVLGVYRSAGMLKTAYDKAIRELEKEQKDNKTSEKILINSFDEKSNDWQYDIDPKQLFGLKHAEKEKANVIVECVMDSPYMCEWKQENIAKDIYGYIFNDTLARALRHDESILVRFDVEHTYQVLDKLAWYWGSWNSCPSWETMRDISKKWHEKYDAELIMIAHDALGFQCRILTEEEAAEIIAEANSLTAEVINCNNELNKNLAGHNSFTLWWD